jgi:putative transposase
VQALERALRRYERPEISNTDQGSQFTSPEYIGLLKDSGIHISMDAKGRALDNIAIERFWRTLKQDEVYLRDYESLEEAINCIGEFIHHYNQERPHASLGGQTPEMAYQGRELRASA